MITSNIRQTAKTGLLLNAITQASSANASTPLPTHDKLDNTGYKFHGRSYGVASAVGLVNDPSPVDSGYDGSLLSFRYKEVGYQSKVACIYNESADLSLTYNGIYDTPGGVYAPVGFWVNGSLPTGPMNAYPAWGVLTNATVNAIAAVRNETTFMYGFVNGGFYSTLNDIQCTAEFTPSLFDVHVEPAANSISVTHLTDDTEPMDHVALDQSVVNTAFMGPFFMAMTLTTMYTGVVGSAFLVNVDNVARRRQHSSPSANDYLDGAAEGLEVLLDHILGSTGAAQVMLQGDSQTTTSNMTVQVMQIGEPKYTYSTFGVSLLIWLLIVAEAIRTRFWRALPTSNVLDLKSAILGVAAATSELSHLTKDWGGDAGDRDVGCLEVTFPGSSHKLSFVEATRDDQASGQAVLYNVLVPKR